MAGGRTGLAVTRGRRCEEDGTGLAVGAGPERGGGVEAGPPPPPRGGAGRGGADATARSRDGPGMPTM